MPTDRGERNSHRASSMSQTLRARSEVVTGIAVIIGAIIVGAIDHLAGAEAHVTSFYFIPLALAGWRPGFNGAVAAAA